MGGDLIHDVMEKDFWVQHNMLYVIVLHNALILVYDSFKLYIIIIIIAYSYVYIALQFVMYHIIA